MSASARPLRAFGFVWACYFAAIGAYNPFAPLWFKELGFSTLAIGTIASLQAWMRVMTPYGWGWLGDRGGRRVRLLRAAALLSLASAAGLLFARGYTAVAFCAVALFFFNGGVVPLSEAMLARHLQTGAGMDAARYGRVRMWGSVGFIVAVVAYGWALEALGITSFPVLVVLTYGALVAATWHLHDDQAPAAAPAAGDAVSVRQVMQRPAVQWFFASIFFTVLAHTALYTFFSLYLDERGWGKGIVGQLWGVSVLAEIVFFWFQGRFLHRLDAYRWLQWAAAVTVLRFVLVAAFGQVLAVLMIAQALHAITFAAQHAACITLIGRHFPGPLRARGQALYSVLGYGLSGVAGGVAGGWITSHLGFSAVFWAAGAAGGVGLWCATRARRADL